jgi:HEAT repeat protein
VLPIAVVLTATFFGNPTVVPAPADEALVRQLIDALKDADPDVRNNLATALAKIGPAAVEPLTAALKDRIPERRAGAAYTLGLLGGSGKSALPALLELLKDDEVIVRRQASYAISKMVPTGGGGR